jgi:hypothetical protein
VANTGHAWDKAATPPRFNRYPEYSKRWSPTSVKAETLHAVVEYVKIADDGNLTLSQLACVHSRRFVKDVASELVEHDIRTTRRRSRDV